MCTDCCCCEKESTNKNLARKNVCCTDIIVLILFIAFVGGMVYISVYSIQRGDAIRLVYGYDSFGNTCNRKNEKIENVTLSGKDTTDMTNVFFMNVFDPDHSMEICVKTCPGKVLDTPSDVERFAVEEDSFLCRYDIPLEDYNDSSLYTSDGSGPCPALPVLIENSLLFRCIPDPYQDEHNKTAEDAEAIISYLNEDETFRKVLSDLYTSWREMCYLCLIAFGLSFAMVLLIRFLAAVIVWVVIIAAAAGSIVGTAFLWWTYADIKSDMSKQDDLDVPLLDVDINNEEAFFWTAIICTVLTVILLLLILVMRKRLLLVVALFKEAGKAVVAMPLMLVQPVWTFLILFAFLAYWLVVLAFIATTDDAVNDPDSDFGDVRGVKYEKQPMVTYIFWYWLVGAIWISEFILASQQFVIAGAVSMWYFTREKSTTYCSCLVAKSACRLLLHHIGTVAFGSFIIVLVKLPRYILMYIAAKLEGADNKCAKCCLKCCICCLWCLEKILKYINQNAYTVVAIKGKSFCPAAKEAFGIIAANALRVTAINSVGDFVLFLGKIGVMAATCAIAVLWLGSDETLHFYYVPVSIVTVVGFFIACCMLHVYESDQLDLNFYFVPVFLVTVVAYLIAHCFLTVYEMVVDALLICFCIDSNVNDGSEGREYFMNRSLMDFVDSASKDVDEIDGKFRPTEASREMHPITEKSALRSEPVEAI